MGSTESPHGFNVFSEAGYEDIVHQKREDARCHRHEQCLNCGTCLTGNKRQNEFCDEECANEYHASHNDFY